MTDLDLLISAAKDAGELATQYLRRSNESWDKGRGQGPVSEADIAVDRMLRETLTAARPDYGWLSEETEDEPSRLAHTRTFIVDPIDGTRAFLAGEPSFAHSLAIVEQGEAIAGVVHLPLKGLTYYAAKGRGAFLNGERIAPSEQSHIKAAKILAGKAVENPAHWANVMPAFSRHFRPSLAYRMCLAAEGKFDAMLALHPAWEWDIAAGDIIGREAGAVVSDKSGTALRFNKPTPKLPGVISAGPVIHGKLLEQLERT